MFSEQQIGRIVSRMRDDYRVHMERLRVRRLIVEMSYEANLPGNGTGSNVPAPFDKSKLIVHALIGDVANAVRDFSSIIGANEPKVRVVPVVADRTEATQRQDRMAGLEERLRSVLWEQAGGPARHRQVTRSQVWGRVGWYFTLRRDRAFGLPDRDYYDDMGPEELDALKSSGRATPEPLPRGDGQAYAESGEHYLERRKQAGRSRAVAARSLYVLDAYPPDVVYAAWDSDGVKWAAAQLEVPAYDFGPGSESAKWHLAHNPEGKTFDAALYGLYFDQSKKRIVGGVTAGGEEDVHQGGATWTYTIFATRDEVYCLCSTTPDGVGTIVWHSEHDFGECPFVPVPAYRTDSMRPGGEFSSPMEKMFAEAPILTQAITMASLIMGYNGVPRWVIVKEDGSLVRDPATGDPMTIASESAPGLDPKDAQVVGGTPMQLKIDADTIFKFLEFYAERFDAGKPSAAATGAEGETTAWGTRQMIEQGLSLLREPVENHAQAVAQIQRMWGRDLRAAGERGELDTIYAFALPTKGARAERTPRGLIEFDPEDLSDAIQVTQTSDTAQARVVKQQAGIERLSSGTTTMRKVLEEFFDADDARQDEIEIMAYDMKRLAFYGDTSKIQPGSVLYDFALALRGRISRELFELSPSYAVASAEQMAQNAQQQTQQSMLQLPPPGGGADIAGAMGVVQPGMGMPLQQTGEPGAGQIPGIAAPVAVGG